MTTTMTTAGAARLARAERIAAALRQNAAALFADRINHDTHREVNGALWRDAETDPRVALAVTRLVASDDYDDAVAACESRIYLGRIVRS